ncbi:hypothetical protein D915_009728 [Fasciola hepatica]|uniref:Uncharacterized protein n=1 Tax=Fasciola hepatica TaxID=6192 RepID=A0A4E0QX90_FASHE|nr:hypothetical protein D915_009728 [Fasciola hepatica]
MESALRKFRHLISGKSRYSQNSDSNDAEDPSEFFPIRYFHLNTEAGSCVQVELLPPGQLIRVFGVDTSLSCLDFTLKLSLLLGLQPGSHLLMVPNLNFSDLSGEEGRGPVSRVWQRAPSNSKLIDWIKQLRKDDDDMKTEGMTSMMDDYGVPVSLRLVHRTCIRNAVRSGLLETHIQHHSKHMCFEGKRATKSGRELLDEIGARVLVHLPRDRKIVIRANLNRPIFESVAEVCTLRSLRPGDHCLRNPHTGTMLDPLLSFHAQCTMEFELRECEPTESNLTCLVNAGNLDQWSLVDAHGGLCLFVNPRTSALGRTTTSPSSNSNSISSVRHPHTAHSLSPKKPVSPYSTRDTVWDAQHHLPPANISDMKNRKKRKAPPPPSPTATRPVMDHALSSRSSYNLCCSRSISPSNKSSSFVRLNSSSGREELRIGNSKQASNSATDPKALSTNLHSETRTLTGSPEINGKVSRAHTLPRASTKSCAKNEPQSPSLTRIKENTFSEWMLTKAIQFSPTHQINNWDEKNHYSTVLTRDLNTLVTLDGCHSKPDSVRMSASDAIKCATEAIPSSAIAGLDMENGTPGRDVNTLNDGRIAIDV